MPGESYEVEVPLAGPADGVAHTYRVAVSPAFRGGKTVEIVVGAAMLAMSTTHNVANGKETFLTTVTNFGAAPTVAGKVVFYDFGTGETLREVSLDALGGGESRVLAYEVEGMLHSLGVGTVGVRAVSGDGSVLATDVVIAWESDIDDSFDPDAPGSERKVSDCSVTAPAAQTYKGKALTPKPTVKYGDAMLREGTDYTLSYKNNVNAGAATVTVLGRGGYTGFKSVDYKINKAVSTISLAAQTRNYNGKAQAYSGKVTRSGSTGKVTYAYYSDSACTKTVVAANVKNAGTYYVRGTLAADANYSAKTSATAQLTIAKVASTISLAAQTKTYTGKALAYSGKVTRSGSVGKVTYKYYSDAKCTKAIAAANVKVAKTYYVKGTLAADANHAGKTSAAAKFAVAKAAQPITAKAANKKASLKTLKTKAVTVARPIAIAKAQGKLSYAKVASGSSAALTVNKTTGKVTVKKGTKKGTYAIKIKVTAAGNANYKAGSKTVTCKVVVK